MKLVGLCYIHRCALLRTEIRTASSSKTRSSSRGRPTTRRPKTSCSDLTPLMGFIVVPLRRQTHRVNSGLAETSRRQRAAKLSARSALAVPPDFGGLLRIVPCEDVALHNRPWGSPCFRSAAEATRHPRRRSTLRSVSLHWQPPLVTRAETLFTSVRALSPLFPGSPHCVTCCHAPPIGSTGPSTSGPCSAREVRCEPAVLPPLVARCSHGLLD